jgi:ABC-type multidrug transport system fused ATPase/permease subunit
MKFTLGLSKNSNREFIKSLLHAPVDKFFDRTPVGRIMNRMSTDLLNIDANTFNHITQMLSEIWTNMIPLAYLHFLMPVYFTCACIPVYYLMFLLVRRFWNTMVPMRYLLHVSKSDTDSTLTDLDNSNAFVRACKKGDFRFQEFQRFLTNQIKADVTTRTFLKRWLVNRLFLMMGFFVSSMVLIAVWVPNSIAIGGVGLCLANMFRIVSMIEPDIDTLMRAQFQLISMKRLHEYTCLVQEADYEKESDRECKSYVVKVKRKRLGMLVRKDTTSGIVIVKRRGERDSCHDQELFQQTDRGMLAALHHGFAPLDPGNPDLKQCGDGHRLVAVNGKGLQTKGSDEAKLEAMVEELVKSQSAEVTLQIQSEWLLPGAHLVIEDLVAGYGDVKQNVLNGVSINIQPRTKVGVVGATGCGKSTLLLCILRILESRSGRIVLNGKDIKTLGLRTLRTTIGMVSQDPVLMQMSVRENLDPFGEFDDNVIREGLDMVQMLKHIDGLSGGLAHEVQSDGGSFSYGQRQLLCLARMVIRQPRLILLDEATSALDPATQQQVQNTIENYFPDSTIVMIAHRLETIAKFNQVIVMDGGAIVEHGNPEKLREQGRSKFAQMWAAKRTW